MKIILFLLFPVMLFLTRCKPDESPSCPGGSTTTNDLSATELSKVPYTGFDTLYFLGNTGDTHIVVGGGKQYYYDTEAISGGGPDCPRNIVTNNQAYKIQFSPIKGDLTFTFIQERVDREVVLKKNNYPVEFITRYDFLGAQYPYPTPIYIDSMVINGIKYGRIYQGIPMKNDGNRDSSYQSLCNHANGVLLLKSEKDNEAYTILKK